MPSFRLDDMVRPPINWRLLGEEPGVEMVLDQIGRPWQPTEMGSGPEVAPCEFAAFDEPGFAKIALSLRVQPYGAEASILTLETRVAVTDPVSLKRFQRYWALIGPFSHLVRSLALGLVAADLRNAQLGLWVDTTPTTRVGEDARTDQCHGPKELSPRYSKDPAGAARASWREGNPIMRTLVTYASKYGATRQIAERIAEQLRAAGLEVDVQPVKAIGELAGYDAVVLGSAVYYGSWMKEAVNFARRNQTILSTRPVWLFSSGPLGTGATDGSGQDLREAAIPKDIAELTSAIKPRDHRVFLGALNRARLSLLDRLVASLPAFPGVEGDFRDWADVEAWAGSIAHELAPVPAGVH